MHKPTGRGPWAFHLAPGRMNRRDFFNPQRLVGVTAEALGLLDELRADEPAAPSESPALLRCGRRAMATLFEVIVPFGTEAAQDAAEAALDEIDRLEAQLTVYRDESEVCRLNRTAALAPVPLEEGLFNLIALAARLTAETEGAYDISVGALVKAWGFYRRQGRVPSAEEREAVTARVGMKNVVLDPERRTVAFLRRGVEINLGSIGKGYAVDRAVELLRRDWGVGSALVHGGRSSIYALGDEPGGSGGWSVGVLDPRDHGRRLAVLRLRDRALGTSGMAYQHLSYNGRRLGHILDPRTAWPAEGMLGATVTAPTAAEADALATAFFLLGPEKARAYCERRPDVGAVLVPESAPPVVLNIPAAAIEIARP